MTRRKKPFRDHAELAQLAMQRTQPLTNLFSKRKVSLRKQPGLDAEFPGTGHTGSHYAISHWDRLDGSKRVLCRGPEARAAAFAGDLQAGAGGLREQQPVLRFEYRFPLPLELTDVTTYIVCATGQTDIGIAREASTLAFSLA